MQSAANRDREYIDADGEISPLHGSMQLVFSDLGVPMARAGHIIIAIGSTAKMYRYMVERSLGQYNRQTTERKSEFIAQIMTGRIDVREVEDIGDSAMLPSETERY